MCTTGVTRNLGGAIMLGVGLGALSFSPRPALAGGIVGSGTPGSCTEAALDTALTGGGSVTFNYGARPVTITVTT